MKEKKRFWLTFSADTVLKPVIWEMGQKFKVVFNIRNASVTKEVGIIGLEIEGERELLKEVVTWLESIHVQVEPVEINTIE